jgi:hypothetical protein
MPATSECVYCGQTANAKPCDCHGERPPFGICDSCREREREPQGEAVRLFTPAPAQMPGQTMLEVAYGNWTGDGRPRSDPWPFSRENPGT